MTEEAGKRLLGEGGCDISPGEAQEGPGPRVPGSSTPHRVTRRQSYGNTRLRCSRRHSRAAGSMCASGQGLAPGQEGPASPLSIAGRTVIMVSSRPSAGE